MKEITSIKSSKRFGLNWNRATIHNEYNRSSPILSIICISGPLNQFDTKQFRNLFTSGQQQLPPLLLLRVLLKFKAFSEKCGWGSTNETGYTLWFLLPATSCAISLLKCMSVALQKTCATHRSTICTSKPTKARFSLWSLQGDEEILLRNQPADKGAQAAKKR